MTVETLGNVSVFRGNGVTTVFPFTFKILDEDHLIVQRRVFTTGVVDHTYTSGEYEVAGVGDSSGTVTITPALADTYELIIQRIVPLTQPLDIVNQSGFFPQSIEDQLDLLTMGIQQVDAQLGLSIQLPPGSTEYTTGTPEARALTVMGFDADGNYVERPLSDVIIVPVASDIIYTPAGGTPRTVSGRLDDVVSVKNFGAVGDGDTDNSTAFQTAYDTVSAAGGGEVFVPDGIYILDCLQTAPNAVIGNDYIGYQSHLDPQFGDSLIYAVEMKSNVTLRLSAGAVIKAADDISSDSVPQNWSLFFSLASIENVGFVGEGTIDGNAANNLMSPNRAATGDPQEDRYNRMHQTAIMLEGPYGKVDDLLVEGITFQNFNGVNVIVTGRVALPTLGTRQYVRNNKFLECGLDTYDCSVVNMMANVGEISGNHFENAALYGPTTADLSGLSACYETHGSNIDVFNNTSKNTNRTGFISYALNYRDWPAIDAAYAAYPWGHAARNIRVFKGRHLGVKYAGAQIGFAPITGVTTLPGNIEFTDNLIEMSNDDTNLTTEIPTVVECVGSGGVISGIDEMLIARNKVSRTASASGRASQFLSISLQATGFNNILVRDNVATGLTRGENIVSDTNTVAGVYRSRRNHYLSPLGGTIPAVTRVGILHLAQGGTISDMFFENEIIDQRPTAACTFTDAGDLITSAAHGLDNGDTVTFDEITTTTGITVGVVYFVISSTTNTYQVSLTAGGGAVALTTNGSGVMKGNKWAFGIVATVSGTPKVRQFHVGKDSIFDRAMHFTRQIDLSTLNVGRRLGVPVSITFTTGGAYAPGTGADYTGTLNGVGRAGDRLEFVDIATGASVGINNALWFTRQVDISAANIVRYSLTNTRGTNADPGDHTVAVYNWPR